MCCGHVEGYVLACCALGLMLGRWLYILCGNRCFLVQLLACFSFVDLVSMEEAPDLDYEMEFWKGELEEEGARKDVMPPPLPPPIGNMRIIRVSSKAMLAELVKEIPARDPRFQTWYRYGGFFSNVRVDVPDLVDPAKLRQEFCSSFEEFRTAEEAEEKVAERMIRTLESSCKFETKDLNWEKKGLYHVNNYNSCVGWRCAQEENQALKKKVKELKKGWRDTLDAVERWCGYMRSCGFACPEYDVPFVLHEGITDFERVCEESYL